MREIFTEIFENQPLDPTESARGAMRPRLRKRFYKQATVGEGGQKSYDVLLDGKQIFTPARRPLIAPTRALAEALAAEWNAQKDEIDPARMPLTRLANAVIDAVAENPDAVAAEIEKYLGSDLLCYRAEMPAGLIERQAQHWDPVVAWAQRKLGARFVLGAGVVHVKQPDDAITSARAAIPRAADNAKDSWRLGAISSITALTGSALLALALAAGAIDVEAAWTAAHVDEDWQMAQWGRDEIALARRDFRYAEMQAAAKVLTLLR